MERFGIYGGTFNPIHNGHLHLIRAACAQLSFDRLLVVPANIPPHKAAVDLASNRDRLEMARLATAGMPGVWVSDIELRARGKSYTVLTLERLRALFPECRFTLLMGADMLESFDRWHRWRDILKLADIAAFARNEGEESLLERKAALIGRARVVRVEPLPLSSTLVREKVRRGEDISDLVPEPVAAYIYEKGLYR
ncbi:MAG TPA: nicotinate (nicotinamide) nucleotide adenylyltransferase [Candidatus Merdivicinus faecavium]|nr:nicotinate (nicotinamide) nucleotide adenylyltransferase [Candidatus Merdivicinus faecavium]